ncbi:MAG: P-loop NTPase [Planctomycetaceae bacterium]
MPLSTVQPDPTVRNDQARELRAMIARRASSAPIVSRSTRRCKTVVIAGSKGGTGKSVVALNLALALGNSPSSVSLLDSSGIGSLSLLCGQNGYWNLDHVAAGIRTVEEVTLSLNSNVAILPGVNHLLTSSVSSSTWRSLVEFERRHDWFVIDTGSDLDQTTQFARTADATIIVTTPEPTSVAEAYGAMKSLCARGVTAISILVNQVDSEDQALLILDRLRHAAKAFLSSDIGLAGIVPVDPEVTQSVFRRTPLVADVTAKTKTSQAGQAIESLAGRLMRVVTTDRELSCMESLRNALNGSIGLAELEETSGFSGTISKIGPVGISRRNKVN